MRSKWSGTGVCILLPIISLKGMCNVGWLSVRTMNSLQNSRIIYVHFHHVITRAQTSARTLAAVGKQHLRWGSSHQRARELHDYRQLGSSRTPYKSGCRTNVSDRRGTLDDRPNIERRRRITKRGRRARYDETPARSDVDLAEQQVRRAASRRHRCWVV